MRFGYCIDWPGGEGRVVDEDDDLRLFLEHEELTFAEQTHVIDVVQDGGTYIDRSKRWSVTPRRRSP